LTIDGGQKLSRYDSRDDPDGRVPIKVKAGKQLKRRENGCRAAIPQ